MEPLINEPLLCRFRAQVVKYVGDFGVKMGLKKREEVALLPSYRPAANTKLVDRPDEKFIDDLEDKMEHIEMINRGEANDDDDDDDDGGGGDNNKVEGAVAVIAVNNGRENKRNGLTQSTAVWFMT